MGKNLGKQFNFEKRETLSRMIAKNKTAKDIGEAIGMNPTSISRELKRNRIKTKEEENSGSFCSKCIHKRGCTIKKVCGSINLGSNVTDAKLFLNVTNLNCLFVLI